MGSIPVAKPRPLPGSVRARRGVALLALAVVFLGSIAVGYAMLAPKDPPPIVGPKWVEVANINDLEVGAPLLIQDHRLFVVKLESGEILALSRRDPRLGCTVPWNPDFEFMGTTGWFRNPCHNQTYDLTGFCYFGPCIRGLDRYRTRVEGDAVSVRIGDGTLITGPDVDPTRDPVTP